MLHGDLNGKEIQREGNMGIQIADSWASRRRSGKESTCDEGDMSSVPGLGRSPGGGNGNLLQYSCLGNPMDRGAWRAVVHGVAKSRTQLK